MTRMVRDTRGFALILTMVISVLMVAVVVELIYQVYVDVSLSRGFRDGQQASLYAESGITGGTMLVKMSLQSQEFTSLSDLWAQPQRLEDETGSIEISVSEESGKINLTDLVLPNGETDPFTLAVLQRIGKRLQLPEDIWNTLADWMDSDDLPRSNSAESVYYKTMKPSYTARNAKLRTFPELTLIRGFTPEILVKLRPFVTVYAGQSGGLPSQVNINTAAKEVLTALDDTLDDRMAERIAEERRLKPFRSAGELSRIPGAEILSQKLVGKISVKGTLFRITSIARVKESARTVEAVMRLGNGAPEILSWQEY